MATPIKSREVRMALAKYDELYLECRDMRHSWKLLGWAEDGGNRVRVLQCTRCPATRTDRWVAMTGARLNSTYRYPTDYKLGPGVTHKLVRKEVLNRVRKFTDLEDLIERAREAA